MKTFFEINGMKLRISKDECGDDRFTKQEIIKAINEGEAKVIKHCLCRYPDGKIYAEILNYDQPQHLEPVVVYVARVSYVYLDEKCMRETSSSIDFLAKNANDAIDALVAWANNRYNAIYKDMYKNCEIGCLKLYQKQICQPETSGFINTHTIGFVLFEWKYDWPGTLKSYIKSFKSSHKND
jgi:hypothetical protein